MQYFNKRIAEELEMLKICWKYT